MAEEKPNLTLSRRVAYGLQPILLVEGKQSRPEQLCVATMSTSRCRQGTLEGVRASMAGRLPPCATSPWSPPHHRRDQRQMGHRIATKLCKKCGKSFRPTHGNAAYCSALCYMAGSVSHVAESGCFVWNGSVDTYGYGHARWGGGRRKAHVMAIELAGKTLGPGMVVRHLCGNSRCCNPEHLTLGSHRENMADKARSGIVAGERCPHAALTNAQAREIYELRDEGTSADIAARTGAKIQAVRAIWNGTGYAGITGAIRRPKGRRCGEENPSAKLTNDQARAIYALKGIAKSAAAAARQLGLPCHLVRKIWNGIAYSQSTGAQKPMRNLPLRVVPCVVCDEPIATAAANRKYCSLQCVLMAHVAKGEEHDCWLWTARSKSRGYGQLQFCGSRHFAHHVAFDIAFPEKAVKRKAQRLTVSHRCHNPLCCNPAHLEIMSLADNVRQNRGRGVLCGENNHQARMAEVVARRILEMIQAGERTFRIVERINRESERPVTTFQVTDIRRGRTWSHIAGKTQGGKGE